MKKILCAYVLLFTLVVLSSYSFALKIEIVPGQINPINPGSGTIVDDIFAVDVMIRDASQFVGFEFVMEYDPDVVTIDSLAEGDFLFREGGTIDELQKKFTIDNGLGVLTFAMFVYPDYSVAGEGTLATITFNVESLGDSVLHFNEEVSEGTDLSEGLPDWIDAVITPRYHIAVGTGDGGIIGPSGNESGNALVSPGANQTFTITPDECYEIAGVTVDNGSVGTGSSYTFTNVSENHAISANFVKKTLTIEASATEGGTISPSDSVPMTCGQDKSFTITPAYCHRIKDVKVDGSSVITDMETDDNGTGTYMLEDVRNSHTIEAEFEKVFHTITASSGEHGIIDLSGEVTAECGSEPVFTITPADCYQIEDVTVGEESVKGKEEFEINTEDIGTYTFRPVTEDQEIEATFSPIVYAMKITAGEGGSVKLMLGDEEKAEISGGDSGTVDVDCGSGPTILISPDDCYEIADVKVNDIETDGAADSHTLPPLDEDQRIEVSFAIKKYTITVSETEHITIEPSGEIIVECGSEPVFTITPAPLPPEDGYKIKDVKVDEISVMEGVTTEDWIVIYTFPTVTQSHTIEAISAKTHHITASAGENGAIEPFGDVFAADGDNQTFTITPDDGYYSSDVSIVSRQDAADGEPAETEITAGPLTDHIVLTDVKSDFEIRAEFGQNPKITVTPAENGTISPSEEVSVEYGEDQEFIIMPDKFYHLTGVVTDDESVEGEEIDGTGIHLYKFYEVTQDHSLEATFECTDSDINGDKTADLADAILILKLLAGIDITDAISPCADVNEDGRIGMTELLSVLYAMTGGR